MVLEDGDPRIGERSLLVALAGPLMNLLLAFLALTGLAVWMLGTGGELRSLEGDNLREFLWVLGYTNLAMAVFNLVPIPPLDGSTVLAGLSDGYRRAIARVQNPMVFVFAFMALWAVFSSREHNLYGFAAGWAERYLQLVFRLAGR